MTKIEHQSVSTNGIRLHVATSGPSDGPLLIFLHGFPECWMGWQKQIDYFAAQGYRVLAPDQRGYNLSDKPRAVADYCLDQLADDILGLISWAGRSKTLLVGHDWGAAVSWYLAARNPELVEKLVILNVPHPRVMQKNLKSNFRQIARSWYILFFQIPGLPEWVLSLGQAQLLSKDMRRTGAFSEEELSYYHETWRQPGALRSMLNWYRAALQNPPRTKSTTRIASPTLVIWGADDRFLRKELASQSVEYCDRGRLELIEGATHWVQHEKADRVNQLIEAFIAV